jgi:hypothetical protein
MPRELDAVAPRHPALRVRTEGILSPIVPFEESAEAYRQNNEYPERAIKLGIRFD